jgi:hemoglobin
MLTTHKGMNISEQEFLAVVDDIMGAMNKNDVGEDEQKDVLSKRSFCFRGSTLSLF